MRILFFFLALLITTNTFARCFILEFNENSKQVPEEVVADIKKKVSNICYDSIQIMLFTESVAQISIYGGHPFDGLRFNPPIVHVGSDLYKVYSRISRNNMNGKIWMTTIQLDFLVPAGTVGTIISGPRFDLWYSDFEHKTMNIGTFN